MTVAADRGAQADDQRDGSARPGHATACVRAGLFALVGTVLAALGHHAVAEGPFPWRLVSAFTLVQFGLIWPAARRRLPLSMILACTLTAQGSLHLALTWAGAATAAHTGLETHRSTGVVHPATGDGHVWHHASAAMTAAHVTAALLAGWLLHRADATVSGGPWPLPGPCAASPPPSWAGSSLGAASLRSRRHPSRTRSAASCCLQRPTLAFCITCWCAEDRRDTSRPQRMSSQPGCGHGLQPGIIS
ncbi:hypothetical protein RKD37_001119 [Streptomyces ambofaciens]